MRNDKEKEEGGRRKGKEKTKKRVEEERGEREMRQLRGWRERPTSVETVLISIPARLALV